jgi:hypothetical protein
MNIVNAFSGNIGEKLQNGMSVVYAIAGGMVTIAVAGTLVWVALDFFRQCENTYKERLAAAKKRGATMGGYASGIVWKKDRDRARRWWDRVRDREKDDDDEEH